MAEYDRVASSNFRAHLPRPEPPSSEVRSNCYNLEGATVTIFGYADASLNGPVVVKGDGGRIKVQDSRYLIGRVSVGDATAERAFIRVPRSIIIEGIDPPEKKEERSSKGR